MYFILQISQSTPRKRSFSREPSPATQLEGKKKNIFNGYFPNFKETFHAPNDYALQFVPHNSNGKKRKTINDERQTCVENQPVDTSKTNTGEFKKFSKTSRDINVRLFSFSSDTMMHLNVTSISSDVRYEF